MNSPLLKERRAKELWYVRGRCVTYLLAFLLTGRWSGPWQTHACGSGTRVKPTLELRERSGLDHQILKIKQSTNGWEVSTLWGATVKRRQVCKSDSILCFCPFKLTSLLIRWIISPTKCQTFLPDAVFKLNHRRQKKAYWKRWSCVRAFSSSLSPPHDHIHFLISHLISAPTGGVSKDTAHGAACG